MNNLIVLVIAVAAAAEAASLPPFGASVGASVGASSANPSTGYTASSIPQFPMNVAANTNANSMPTSSVIMPTTSSLAAQCSWCNYDELAKYTDAYFQFPSMERLKATYDLALQSLASDFSNEGAWLSPPQNKAFFEATTSPYAPESTFQLFTRRVLVNANDRLIVWGDVHGGFKTLVKTLKGISSSSDPNRCMDRKTLKLADNCRLIFLGDYVDRGTRSIETLYTLLILRIVNGNKVQLVRGNHEQFSQNNKTGSYPTTNDEIRLKYDGNADAIVNAIDRFYQFLPFALFIGAKSPLGSISEVQYMQFCHGATSTNYLPNNLLAASTNTTNNILNEYIGNLDGYTVLARIQQVDSALHARIVNTLAAQPAWGPYTFYINSSTASERNMTGGKNGYLWADLMDAPNATYPDFFVNTKRGAVIGYPLAEGLLKAASTPGVARLRGIIRGHQHNGQMLQRLIRARGFVNWYSLGNGANPLCPEVTTTTNKDHFIATTISAAEAGFTTTEGTLAFAARNFVDITCGSTWNDWSINHKWYNDGSYETCQFGPSVANLMTSSSIQQPKEPDHDDHESSTTEM